MDKKILDIINEYLRLKNKPEVGFEDSLYSSGLLDSLEMFELIMFLQLKSFSIKNKTENLQMEKIDSPMIIVKLLGEK